jgi:hypothetical protein
MMSVLSYEDIGPDIDYWQMGPVPCTSGLYGGFPLGRGPQRIETKYTEGGKTPHFTSRMKRGELIPYTFFKQTYTKCEVTASHAYVRAYNGSLCSHWDWANFAPANAQAVKAMVESAALVDRFNYADDGNYYVQAAAAAIYASGFDALTFVAELREAHALFKRTSFRVLKFYERVRRDKPLLSAKKLEKELSHRWLSERYGMAPLRRDLQQLTQAVEAFQTERFTRFRKRVGADSFITAPLSAPVINWDPWGNTQGSGKLLLRGLARLDIGIRGSVAADISPPVMQVNVPLTAWELIRFSFVVDRLINVGQAINAVSMLLTASAVTSARGMAGRISMTPYLETQDLKTCDVELSYAGSFVQEVNLRVPTKISVRPLVKLRLDPLFVVDLVGLASNLRRP